MLAHRLVKGYGVDHRLLYQSHEKYFSWDTKFFLNFDTDHCCIILLLFPSQRMIQCKCNHVITLGHALKKIQMTTTKNCFRLSPILQICCCVGSSFTKILLTKVVESIMLPIMTHPLSAQNNNHLLLENNFCSRTVN